jgi:HPt (histidine-containing phosphotransfer) domain-containing protein
VGCAGRKQRGLTMLSNSYESEVLAPSLGSEPLQVSPVDLKHLRRYTMGDANLEKEILDLFLGQLPKTIQALADAVNEREWKVAAHTLKGSGRAVGAWRVARLAEHAERQLNVQNKQSCQDAVARIEEAAAEARQFIRATYPANA